jgi:hypothetical protein
MYIPHLASKVIYSASHNHLIIVHSHYSNTITFVLQTNSHSILCAWRHSSILVLLTIFTIAVRIPTPLRVWTL